MIGTEASLSNVQCTFTQGFYPIKQAWRLIILERDEWPTGIFVPILFPVEHGEIV